MDTKQAFWDSQAAKGELSGTQDRYAKELEMAAIARHVKDGMLVLDVGCGDGETITWLTREFGIVGNGIDSSCEMIKRAKDNLRDEDVVFWEEDIINLGKFRPDSWDLIYTQRALINLDSWEEQRQAILDILGLLRPGGLYVMVECFTEGLDEINDLRIRVGLESIVPPWHNLYLSMDNLDDLFMEINKDLESIKVNYFSGAYYFMSRVVNAWWADQEKVNPNYLHPFNKLGTLLPPECVNLRGQTQAWIIKKKEG